MKLSSLILAVGLLGTANSAIAGQISARSGLEKVVVDYNSVRIENMPFRPMNMNQNYLFNQIGNPHYNVVYVGKMQDGKLARKELASWYGDKIESASLICQDNDKLTLDIKTFKTEYCFGLDAKNDSTTTSNNFYDDINRKKIFLHRVTSNK